MRLELGRMVCVAGWIDNASATSAGLFEGSGQSMATERYGCGGP